LRVEFEFVFVVGSWGGLAVGSSNSLTEVMQVKQLMQASQVMQARQPRHPSYHRQVMYP